MTAQGQVAEPTLEEIARVRAYDIERNRAERERIATARAAADARVVTFLSEQVSGYAIMRVSGTVEDGDWHSLELVLHDGRLLRVAAERFSDTRALDVVLEAAP